MCKTANMHVYKNIIMNSCGLKVIILFDGMEKNIHLKSELVAPYVFFF